MAVSAPPVLRVRDLSVTTAGREGGKVLVDGVDLDLVPGEILGVVGESGSGKSTLCRALAGVLSPTTEVSGGTATLGDSDLLGRRPGRRGVGMVFQEPRAALNPVMRVGDQIVEALRVRGQVGGREARTQAVALLERLGLPEPSRRMSAFPEEFSGGQCQRLVLAVALASEPAVLLADEPTSALDVTTQAQILELMRELARERQMGIVMVSHNYAVVAQLCDRTMVMYGGRVVETGPTAELLFAPRHPYTEALIGSLPDVDRRAAELAVIPGRAPEVGPRRDGCPFAPRCPHAEPACRSEPMPLRTVDQGSGHASACRRVGELWPASA